MTIKFSNPLRYPGSKSGFIEEFSQYVKTNNLVGKEIVEPYAGSASIALGLLHKGLVSSAVLIERDPLIFSFWFCVFHKTDALINAIEHLNINLDTWHSFEKYRDIDEIEDDQLLSIGLAGLFFNRTNFSGVLHAGPIGGKGQKSEYSVDCRFNKKDIIKRIILISKMSDKVSVHFGDAIAALKDANELDNSNRFFYIDPPYYVQGQKLYRYHYKLSDHKRLAESLTEAKYKWVLSYDNHHVIEHFYSDFDKITRDFRYSSRSPKQEKELLITNIDGWIQPTSLYKKNDVIHIENDILTFGEASEISVDQLSTA
jgi:DNA adenine methylase